LIRLLGKFVVFYAVFVIAWFVANTFFQDTVSVQVALDKFASYFLVLSVPVLVLSLFTKRLWISVLAVIPVAISAYFYGSYLIPQGVGRTSDAPRITIATYNIWNHNTDFDGIAALVDSLGADVIALQEITEDQRDEIEQRLKVSHPHSYISREIYGGTTGLFSKRPLSNIQELDFGIDRPAILADVSVGEETVTVISAHLNPSYWSYANQPLMKIPARFHQYIKDQNTQATMIMDAAAERIDSRAVVLACDCNMQVTASTYKFLSAHFVDAHRQVGYQTGQPSNSVFDYEDRLGHLDYLLMKGEIKVTALYRAKETMGSDHAPVVGDFELTTRSN